MTATTATLPKAFVWRRLHSLMGLWLVLFLIEHLLTNSQAALLFGDDARGFVSMVNGLHNLPYLEAIELFLLGVPILFHLVLGIKYLLTSESNSGKSNGSKVSLPQYGRNRAYTWQRITSWILVFMLIGHIVKFRFLEYPTSVKQGSETLYFAKVNMDNGLYTLAERLGVQIYDKDAIEKEKYIYRQKDAKQTFREISEGFLEENSLGITGPALTNFDPQKQIVLNSMQRSEKNVEWVQALDHYSLKPGQVVVQAKDFGTASLLIVRDTFKNPIYVFLYTIFVVSACFHAFNGFWTFLITWGVVLKAISQRAMNKFAIFLMILLTLLGLAAVWGTYWINLRS